jgi:signal transduction histidine kinase
MIKMEMRGQADAIKARAKVLHQLLVWSVVALGTMAVLSVALGWIMAGRMLRPLRTITATARSISATSLHRRLDLDSPEDELKELGDTFDDLLSRLEASFQAQRQFVANASHELRSPLARQRTVGQVAILDPDATVASLRAAHEAILRAGAQQEKILEALLTLSRGQAGIDVHEPFDLAVLATEVIDARRTEAHALGISLSGSCATAAASGHARLAQQLVTNLVDNALRHNHEDGRVEVRTSLVEGRATLTVSNTGPVVPESAVERLFQPFQRLGTARTGHGKAAGFGLGLSIVQAIAKAHDATISTLTQPAGGLAITVTFPPVPAGVPPAPRTPSARPATDETLPKPLLP